MSRRIWQNAGACHFSDSPPDHFAQYQQHKQPTALQFFRRSAQETTLEGDFSRSTWWHYFFTYKINMGLSKKKWPKELVLANFVNPFFSITLPKTSQGLLSKGWGPVLFQFSSQSYLAGGWTNPVEKYATVKLDRLPRGRNKKCLSFHHLITRTLIFCSLNSSNMWYRLSSNIYSTILFNFAYIYLESKWLSFWLENALFWEVDLQK